jgi:hypothetical protein
VRAALRVLEEQVVAALRPTLFDDIYTDMRIQDTVVALQDRGRLPAALFPLADVKSRLERYVCECVCVCLYVWCINMYV